MKKLLLGAFLLVGILSFSERRITIKSGSYCTGYLGATGYDDEFQITKGGTLWEYYMFKKCVINGRTYYGTASQDNGSRAALRVYFNDFTQRSYISDLIENSRRINLKSGVTAVDEGEGNWGINVNKIEIK